MLLLLLLCSASPPIWRFRFAKLPRLLCFVKLSKKRVMPLLPLPLCIFLVSPRISLFAFVKLCR